jgi:hypothetical protein
VPVVGLGKLALKWISCFPGDNGSRMTQ